MCRLIWINKNFKIVIFEDDTVVFCLICENVWPLNKASDVKKRLIPSNFGFCDIFWFNTCRNVYEIFSKRDLLPRKLVNVPVNHNALLGR